MRGFGKKMSRLAKLSVTLTYNEGTGNQAQPIMYVQYMHAFMSERSTDITILAE